MYLVNRSNFILVFTCFIILLKLSFINIDPPKWEIANYQPIDELFYAFPAYNLFENGSLFAGDKIVVFGTPWLTNLFTYIGLLIFGDNYLGLRFGSILLTLVSVFFFWKILQEITQNLIIQFCACLFLALNYSFTLSSLIVEPTIARTAAALFSFYLISHWVTKKKQNPSFLFLCSIVITVLWIFTYPTNAFVLFALFVIVVFSFFQFKHHLVKGEIIDYLMSLVMHIYPFVGGVLVGLVVWVVFALSLGEGPLDFMFRGDIYSSRVGLSFKEIVKHFIFIAKANIFLFNPFLLFLFVSSLFYLTFLWIKGRGFQSKYLLIFIYSFIFQTLFINDFPKRKLVILLPYVLLIIVSALANFNSQKIDNKSSPLQKKTYLIFGFLLLGVLGFSVCIWLDNGTIINKAAQFIFFSLLVYFLFLMRIPSHIKKLKYILPVFIVMTLIEIHSSFRFSFNEPSYYYESMLKNLSEYDNKHFLGGWSLGFAINNDIVYSKSNPYIYVQPNEIENLTKYKMKSYDQEIYSIRYAEDSIKMRNMGFKKLKLIMKAENTVFTKDWILYCNKNEEI